MFTFYNINKTKPQYRHTTRPIMLE